MDWSYSREFRSALYCYSISSLTIIEQCKVEDLVSDAYYKHKETFKENYLKLYKLIHTIFTKSNLCNLSNVFESLDASQTWLMYWNIHSLKLLNFKIPEDLKEKIINDIKSCQNATGGFGGGPYQLSHMATTYASVLALIELETEKALDAINTETLFNWFMTLRQKNGAFVMHEGGEIDVRGCYCAISVAIATNLPVEQLFKGTAEWIASCQTYEGGFGGAPGLEAHGGYSFCALASLVLLGREDLIDRDKLLHWAAHRQMCTEGGFQGRTNKLVDSCYTFWVGALFPLLQRSFESNNWIPLFDTNALQEYVIICCQRLNGPVDNPSGGGLIDKPGKNADPYHTCYGLSGLSIAQSYERSLNRCCLGSQFQNDLEDIDPVFNVSKEALEFCKRFFKK